MSVHASFPTCNSLLCYNELRKDNPTNTLCDSCSHAHTHTQAHAHACAHAHANAHANAHAHAHAHAHAITQLMEVHEHVARLTGMKELSLTNNTIRKISESVCSSLTRCPPVAETHNTHARTHARMHARAHARTQAHMGIHGNCTRTRTHA
jgi:hypothetical protein